METNGRKKIPLWLTPSLIVQAIVWIFLVAFYVSSISTHISSQDVHMSYQTKVREFVPRNEFEALKKQLDRIEEHTKSLEEYMRGKK